MFFDNMQFRFVNIGMDDDHNQETGFVTEEVNQIIKVRKSTKKLKRSLA